MHTWLLLKWVPLISCHDVKASLMGGKSLTKKKKLLSGKDQGGVIAKEQVVVLLKKSILCPKPQSAPLQPPRIMSLCWCHIDYADRKLPLFVPRSLPSVIHLQGWAEVTLKAIFSMFSAFSGHDADSAGPTGGPGDSSSPSHSGILIAF